LIRVANETISQLCWQPASSAQGIGHGAFQRRVVTLPVVADFRHEIQALDAARSERRLRRSGNWSLDQCCQHLGRWIEFSIDGFPFKYPWHYRLVARLVRLLSWRLLVSLAVRPGFTNPVEATSIEPDAAITDGDGVAYLLRQISRVEKGERMVQPSPVEGRITHDQWYYFHLRHAELHLSFQHPISPP
jgi:hypothetical protein